MKAATSFTEVLRQRGRIVIFTPSATVGLRFEQHAERHHAQVVTTRGWADRFGPISTWNRIHDSGEFGVLSCDQQRYMNATTLKGTDFVWVGETGHPLNLPYLWAAFSNSMSRGDPLNPPNLWLLAEDAL
jgi:hypothetical protein